MSPGVAPDGDDARSRHLSVRGVSVVSSIHQPLVDKSGMSDQLDRLAKLLRHQAFDRIDAFLDEVTMPNKRKAPKTRPEEPERVIHIQVSQEPGEPKPIADTTKATRHE
jgi:hypothetical protein